MNELKIIHRMLPVFHLYLTSQLTDFNMDFVLKMETYNFERKKEKHVPIPSNVLVSFFTVKICASFSFLESRERLKIQKDNGLNIYMYFHDLRV